MAREESAGLWISARPGPLAGDTFSFGFSGAGEAMRALTTLAAQELRPVADALVSLPAGQWQPVPRTDQRFLE